MKGMISLEPVPIIDIFHKKLLLLERFCQEIINP